MNKQKIVGALLTTVLMTTVFAGCGDKNQGAADNSPSASAAPATPTKITIMANLHTAEVPSDVIEKLVEEKTNTDITFQWVPDGSYEEKLNASFATGTLPQATFMKNQSTLLMFRDAIRNGQFWEIGPLLKDYPNLKNLDPTVVNNISVDGKVYAIYQERPLSRQGVIYRKDWADKLGLAEPKTTEDLYNMAKAFKEKDPDGNGKADTIGFTDRNDLIYGAFKTLSSYFGTPNGWGLKDGKLQPDFMDPAYIETMKFIQRLHKDGLINKDFPVTSKTDQQNLFVTGKAGIYIGSMQDVQSLNPKLIELNKEAKMDVANRIKGPNGKEGVWAIPGYGSAVMFPKNAVKTEKELKSILAFFDKLMSPELANLIYYGVEGKHYTLQEGKVVVTDDSKLFDREVKPYQALQVGGPSTVKMLESFWKLSVKAKAEQLVLDNNKILINDPTAPLDSKTYAERGVRLQEIIKDATYKFMLSSIDEAAFKAEVEKWRKEGGDKIIEEYNASYQAAQKK